MTCVIPFSRMIRAMLSLSWTSQYTKLPLTTSSLFSFTSEATTEPGCLYDSPSPDVSMRDVLQMMLNKTVTCASEPSTYLSLSRGISSAPICPEAPVTRKRGSSS